MRYLVEIGVLIFSDTYMSLEYTCEISVRYLIVYVEWASRVNFVTIFGDLYQNKLWVICNNLNQFAHLSSASGSRNDVIKMASIVLLVYTYKTSYLKQ